MSPPPSLSGGTICAGKGSLRAYHGNPARLGRRRRNGSRVLTRRRLLVHAWATVCARGPGRRYSWSSRRCSRANTLSSGWVRNRASTHAVRASRPSPYPAARRRARQVVTGARSQRVREKRTLLRMKVRLLLSCTEVSRSATWVDVLPSLEWAVWLHTMRVLARSEVSQGKTGRDKCWIFAFRDPVQEP